MKIWLAVTPDKYELPITFGESGVELAKLMGIPVASLYQKEWKQRHGVIKGGAYKVRVVEIKEGGR